MVLKFKTRNGEIKAILKDEASEPEGFKYLEGEIPEDFIIPEGVKSLEEMEDLIDNKDGELE
jgi:hypothetical protein